MNNEERSFLKLVIDYSQRHKLFHAKGLYLVALSGGADSVALLRVMKAMGITVHAMHCNFHLRGTESDRDEQFCKDLCERLGIELHLIHFDTKTYSALHHVSIEMAARDLRYAYFNRLAKDLSACGICVAHHRDDCAETVLLNLLRGTGVHGLRGIMPRNGNILRPLLCIGRKDIEQYLTAISQDYVTDSSNLVNDVMRNKIRLDIMPLLEQINPTAKETIAKSAEHIAEATKIVDASTSHSIDDIRVASQKYDVYSIDGLMQQPSSEYVLFTLLERYGFSSQQVHQIHDTISQNRLACGKTWSSDTHAVLLDRGNIVVNSLNNQPFKPMRIPETGTYIIDTAEHKIKLEVLPYEGMQSISKEASCACVDADKVAYPLTLRLYSNGDKFIPFGMRQHKLVSDYLTDKKRNLFDKREQMVLTTHNNEIVWVVNERVDNRFRVSDSTNAVLKIALL